MSDQHPTAKPLLERLADVGDPRTSWKWAHGKMDYVAQLGLSPADIPELISIARQWVDRTDWPDDDRDMTVYAPVHAWRALAHLHAVDAIPALLEMTVIMDERDDDWHMEEFPNVFALIGPASFDPLVAVLSDRHQRLYVRATAATALRKLAERHPQTRPQVVGALRAALADSQANDPGVNGLIISNLMNLNATEAAPEIERAFAADQVDLMVTGNWNTVRQEMGLEDTGLVPPELASRRPTSAIPNLDAFLAARQAMQSRLDAPIAQPVRPAAKVGRNDPCPCGSGKKHKKCCGR